MIQKYDARLNQLYQQSQENIKAMVTLRNRLHLWVKGTNVAVCKRWDINHVLQCQVTCFVDLTIYLTVSLN